MFANALAEDFILVNPFKLLPKTKEGFEAWGKAVGMSDEHIGKQWEFQEQILSAVEEDEDVMVRLNEKSVTESGSCIACSKCDELELCDQSRNSRILFSLQKNMILKISGQSNQFYQDIESKAKAWKIMKNTKC